MKSSRFKLLVLLLALSLVVTVFSNMAPLTAQAEENEATEETEGTQTAEGLREQLEKMTKERDDLQRQMNSLEDDIENNTDEIGHIADQKVIIDQEIGLISQDILLLNKQILAYGLLVADMQSEVDAAQARLDEMTQANKERIRTMEEDGNLSYWSVLFRANSFADLLDRLNMVEEIANADRRRLEGLRQARREVQEKQDAVNAGKEALEAARAEIEQRQLQLVEKRAQADEKMLQLKARHEEYEELLEKAEEAETKLLEEIAKLQKEYEDAKNQDDPDEVMGGSVGGAGNGIVTGVKPPEEVTKDLVWLMPCEFTEIASAYGWREHPTLDYPRFHDGVDLPNEQGTPIVATRAGVVMTRGFEEDGAGYFVSINHGDGFTSTYMHMTHYIVKVNQEVEAGEIIGYMGSTGRSTGPHLHFALSWHDGKRACSQNPADYLPFE